MAQINFPTATSNGQTFEADNGVIYTYVGTPPNGFWSGSFQATGLTTLDARFLKLDSSNDPVTGGLNITGGNVGIGTSSPSSYPGKLVIAGDGTVCEHEFNSRVSSSLTNDSRGFMQVTDGNEQLHIYSPNGGDSVWEVGGTEALRINSSGQIGIGTTSPNNLLDVRGDSDPQIKVSALNTGMLPTSAGLYIENQGQRNWQIWADRGSDQLRIGHNSRASTVVSITDTRVGIGAPQPLGKLHVRAADEVNFVVRDESTAIVLSAETNAGRDNNRLMSFEGSYFNFTTSGTEKFRIQSDGKVGIGSTNPLQKLSVLGTSNDTIDETTGTLRLQGSGGNGLLFGTQASSPYTSYIQSGFVNDISVARYALSLNPLGGGVGINTTNPSYSLDVEGGPSSAQFSSTANWNFSNVYIRRKASNIGIAKMISMMLDGDSASSTNLTSSLNIWGTFSGTPTTSSTSSALNAAMNLGAPEAILFHTNGSERARILPNGRVAINRSLSQSGGQLSIDYTNGITAGLAIKDTKTTGTGVILHVVNGSGGIVGGISQNQSSTSFNTSSDYRLKENIVDLDGAIDRVKQLLPKRFNFINDADTTVDGFLAHEAQVVVPEAVTGTQDETEIIGTLTEWDGTVLETNVTEPTTEELTWEETTINEDGEESTVTRTRTWTPTGNQPVYQGIDQAKLVPLLTAALQEAIAKIETFDQRLTDAGIE